MTSDIKQKEQQRKFHDEVFSAHVTESLRHQGNGKKSLIGDFVAFNSLDEAIKVLPFSIKGKKVLNICSGDGPEGEHLYKMGAKVTVTDISSEAVKAARRRCPYLKGIVADAEKLPFKNNSYDLVVVRAGLHHLPHPYRGIYEMNRVGEKGFIFIEAQKNFITKILIRIGIALEYEDSGNYVYRFTRREIEELMKKLGIKRYKTSSEWNSYFPILSNKVYPRFNNKFSFTVFKFLFNTFNFLFGYFGNSLTVVALKD